MQKIKHWIRKLSVKQKLIFYSYLTITPVLLLVCIALLIYNYHADMTEHLKSDTRNVNSLAESIDMLQTDIKDFSTYISINQKIHNLLTAEHSAEMAQESAQKLWLQDAPMQIVQDMIALKGHIKTIAIYPENGMTPYLRGMDGSVYLSNLTDVKQNEIYQKTLQSKSGMIWRSVPKGAGDTYLLNKDNKIVLYREIFDLSRKRSLGYIVIGVSQTKFQELCNNAVKNRSESILVLDPNAGKLLQKGKVDKKLEKYLTQESFLSQDYRTRKTSFTFQNYNIVCQQLDKNSSIVCKIVPKYELQMQILDVAYMPVMLLIGMLTGILPLLMIISNVFTKPLRQVSHAIQKFSEGDFEQQVVVATEDEVGEVAECFNKMVINIRNLIDQNYAITLSEKESELAALQAQINPHFLYNTLDSLYWQATESGNDEVAENILALSQLFRLVLNQGKNIVSVGQEGELVERYLQLQKMRFQKRLHYEVVISEEIKRMPMPKLMLQPFVENAIVHGFENVNTPCQLTVSGWRENDWIHFEIKDTGIGMRQDQIDALWEEEPANYAKQRIGRYAIKNIRERLWLKYHDKYHLEIQSSVGKGTTVILEIPVEEWDCN